MKMAGTNRNQDSVPHGRQGVDGQSLFYAASQFEGLPVPERQWLVEGLIPACDITLLSGDGGTGKSLLALQLAVATATATSWIGCTVESGLALYLSAEDDDAEIHRRLAAVTRTAQMELADLDSLSVRSLAGEDALLASAGPTSQVLRPTDLFRELDRFMEDHQPALLVLDTLADLFPGNENDRAQARQFIGLLRGLAIRNRCSILLLAHPSLSGISSRSGTSGSTGWNNSVRSRLYLERLTDEGYETDPDARVLRTVKANYGRTGGEIFLRWERGLFVGQARDAGLDRKAANAKAERVFLKLLAEVTTQGRRVNPSGGQTYAPNFFASHPDAEGCTKKALRSAMEALLADGKIKLTTDGPRSKRRQFLEVAE